MKRNKTEFFVLPAFHGDSILIKTFDGQNDEFVILVDGGTAQTFRYQLKAELIGITHIDVLVLTHVDSDHIAGLINLFKSSLIDAITIDEIWMNHPEIVEVDTDSLISMKQGNDLKKMILEKKPHVNLRDISTENKVIDRGLIKFLVLSPTKEVKDELYRQWLDSELPESNTDSVNIASRKDVFDSSLYELNQIPFVQDKVISTDIFNASSISFFLTCPDISILLLADSRPEIIIESLNLHGFNETNPLEADFVKISHHGSLNNTSQELLSLIQSNNFIISTNGGTSDHKHPSRETIARIVFRSSRTDQVTNIYFNYDIEGLKQRIGNFIDSDDFKLGNWKAIYKNRFGKDDI